MGIEEIKYNNETSNYNVKFNFNNKEISMEIGLDEILKELENFE